MTDILPPDDRNKDYEGDIPPQDESHVDESAWTPLLDNGQEGSDAGLSDIRDNLKPDEPEPYAPAPEKPKPKPKPARFIFGEMFGAVFLAWIPVVVAFFLPWSVWTGDAAIAGSLTVTHLIVALIIALPPWVVLLLKLIRGRLLDGIIEMFLWAIWECVAMVILCYLYPGQGENLIWHASEYWNDMHGWLVSGTGEEATPALWLPIHAKHLVMVSVAAFLGGLPALIMGVLQLNYMNYYVARCLLLSDNPLLTCIVAWHFWSVMRVIGYIIISSTLFQLFMKLVFRSPWRVSSFVLGIIFGLLFVVGDGICKWQFADDWRIILSDLCGL